MNDLKDLAAYINPLLAIVGLLVGGFLAWGAVIFSFVLIPILDQIGPVDTSNVDEETQQTLLGKRIFDWLLYLNVPVVFFIVGLFVSVINAGSLSNTELIGNLLSVGIVIGSCGINAAHELGHRKATYEQRLGQVLLIPALYMHFFIEHNRGHHKFVATDEDPASAKKGDWLFWFWIKSLIGSYLSAWKLEAERLQKKDISLWSYRNQMIQFTVIQLIYLALLSYFTTGFGTLIIATSGLVGILLLETINYLEHYGLRRKKLDNGRYERVRPVHSWNANYQIGRIVLYELTRHSDHHYIASKKYQVLDHHDEAPELPFGYPMMILIALVPPLWFKIMDKRIPQI
ncbi:MAG: alkane 1-monooxygenase [Balneolaceae bacterium]|nr:alkane 1-monooxygenase [Balneolaceae bacterium]